MGLQLQLGKAKPAKANSRRLTEADLPLKAACSANIAVAVAVENMLKRAQTI